MTPPLGSRELATYDPPPTMRADLLPDEYRAHCWSCGEITVHAIVGEALQGHCQVCGWPVVGIAAPAECTK